MSATVTATVAGAIAQMSDQALTRSVGLIGIGLLTLLLVQKEFLRATGGTRARAAMRKLNVTIAPLLLMFLVIVLVRLVDVYYFHGVR